MAVKTAVAVLTSIETDVTLWTIVTNDCCELIIDVATIIDDKIEVFVISVSWNVAEVSRVVSNSDIDEVFEVEVEVEDEDEVDKDVEEEDVEEEDVEEDDVVVDVVVGVSDVDEFDVVEVDSDEDELDDDDVEEFVLDDVEVSDDDDSDDDDNSDDDDDSNDDNDEMSVSAVYVPSGCIELSTITLK